MSSKKQLGDKNFNLKSNPSVFYYSIIIVLLLTLSSINSKAQTNLIVNGDFSLTDPNDLESPYFNTEYKYDANTLRPEGNFTINNNPRNVHSNFCIMDTEAKRSPVSGGNMLIGNANSTSSKKLWAQRVPVKTNTNYTFSFWAASLAPNGSGVSNLLFGLYVDCKRMGDNISNSTLCSWQQYVIQINSGNLTSVELAIRNLSIEPNGNDIAIDDISFVETESAIPFPALTERVWLGYTTDWFDADNWGSCTVPSCNDNVTIKAGSSLYPVISSGTSSSYKAASVGSITIESGASLTMNQYSELSVCGNFINKGTIAGNSESLIALTGTSNQNISGNYHNLKINKSKGSAVLNGNIIISNTLTLTQGLIKTNAYEVIVTNSATTSIVSHSSASYIAGNLRRSIQKTGLVVNPSFEHNKTRVETPYGWTTNVMSGTPTADFTETYDGAKGGLYHLTHWTQNVAYDIETYQTITGLPNGVYTLKAWVRSSSDQTAYMFARGFDGSAGRQVSPGAAPIWKQIILTEINVINNQCTIGFRSSSNWEGHFFHMDDVEFVPQLVGNAGFELGGASAAPEGWSSTGTTAADYSENYGGSYEGIFHLTHFATSAYQVGTRRSFSNLTNGTYTLKAWVKSSGGQTSAYMLAKGFNSSNTELRTPNIGNTNGNWIQISIRNIQVTNESCTIGFYSNASGNKWLHMDQVELTKDGETEYDFPVGDAHRYQRIKMTMTYNLAVNSIVGGFSPDDVVGTTGLPINERGNEFKELAKGGYWFLTPDIDPISSGLYNIELFLSEIPNSSDAITIVKRHNASSKWTIENSLADGDYSPKISHKRIGFSTFSEYSVVGAEMVLLPVQLVSFEAELTKQKIAELTWSTESEVSSALFIVEKSEDANEFTKFHEVSAAGNSSSSKAYSALDKSPFSGTTYYRLKQVDQNGTVSYSNIISVNIDKSNEVYGFKVYPNPSSSGSLLNFLIDYNGEAEVSIYNKFGEAVFKTQLFDINTGFAFDFPEVPSGMYLIFVKTPARLYQEKLLIK